MFIAITVGVYLGFQFWKAFYDFILVEGPIDFIKNFKIQVTDILLLVGFMFVGLPVMIEVSSGMILILQVTFEYIVLIGVIIYKIKDALEYKTNMEIRETKRCWIGYLVTSIVFDVAYASVNIFL